MNSSVLELLAKEPSFRQLLSNAPIGMMLHRFGTIVEVNPAASKILAEDSSTMVGRSLLEWCHPDDCEMVAARIEKIRKEKLVGQSLRIRMIRKADAEHVNEASVVFLEIVCIPIEIADETLVMSVFTDVSERVHGERDLAQSENRYRSLYDLSKRQARDLKLIDEVNTNLAPTLEPSAVARETVEAIVRVCGYEMACLYLLNDSRDFLVLQHQLGYKKLFEQLSVQQAVIGRVVRTGVGALITDKTTDPDVEVTREVLGTEICVPIFSAGRVIGALTIETRLNNPLNQHDFDLLQVIADRAGSAFERAHLYRSASNSENRFRRLFDDASVGMLMVDADKMRILESNTAVTQILGYSSDALRMRSLFDLVDEVSRHNLVEHHKANQDHSSSVQQKLDVRLRSKNGRGLWLQLTTSRFFDAVGKLDYCVLMLNDISTEVRSQNLERARNRVLELVASDAPIENSLEEIIQMLSPELPGCAIIGQHSVSQSNDHNRVLGRASKPLLQLLEQGGLPLPTQDDPSNLLPEDIGFVIDIESDHLPSAWHKTFADEKFSIAWQNPLVSGRGEVLGQLVGFHTDQKQFETMDSSLIGAATQLAAIAIESRTTKDKLAFEASHDVLTGLPNRFMFERHLAQAIARARRQNEQLAVLFVDLDRFKRINDTLGHEITDGLLRQVALRLRSCVRAEDTVARFVGDEFLLLVENLNSSEGALRVAQKVLEAFNTPFRLEDPNSPGLLGLSSTSDGQEIFVTVSIGVCVFPNDGDDAISLIRNSDAAMDKAKANGRSTFAFYTPEMHVAVVERLQLENELRRAIERDQLELHYQGQFDLTGKLVGAEALVRWRHPMRGLIQPNYFIPVAEASGLMLPLGNWVLRQACRQATRWGNSNPLWVSVNVSARQFLAADFFALVRSALQDSGLAPERLELELTESVVMDDLELVAKRIAAIKKLGVRVAIDDFGTGYSSLGYLQRLAVDTLKIDRSFLNNLRQNSQSAETTFDAGAGLVLESIINLAHGLGLTVVVEGVEEVWQLELLSRMQVDRLQGFHFARPVSNTEFEGLINAPRNPTPIV